MAELTDSELEREYLEWQRRFPGEFDLPDRKEAFEYPRGEEIKWRNGKPPNYIKADHAYLKGKMMNHPKGEVWL